MGLLGSNPAEELAETAANPSPAPSDRSPQAIVCGNRQAGLARRVVVAGDTTCAPRPNLSGFAGLACLIQPNTCSIRLLAMIDLL